MKTLKEFKAEDSERGSAENGGSMTQEQHCYLSLCAGHAVVEARKAVAALTGCGDEAGLLRRQELAAQGSFTPGPRERSAWACLEAMEGHINQLRGKLMEVRKG